MKSKNRVAFLLLFLISCLLCINVSSHNVSAASWGAKKVYTTPKNTRGTWYYNDDDQVKKLKITAHTVNGVKLYQRLTEKNAKKRLTKLAKADEKEDFKLAKKVAKSRLEADDFKFYGRYGFSAEGWLTAGNDNEKYYSPLTKKKAGKKVTALRVGEGATNEFAFYCYRNKKLTE